MIPIIFDLECIPKGVHVPKEYPSKEPTMEDMPEHGSMKDPDKIAEWKADKLEKALTEYHEGLEPFLEKDLEAWKKRCFNDKTTQVVSIALKVGDQASVVFGGADEVDVITSFCCSVQDQLELMGAKLKDCVWVGHNVIRFDLPILRSKLMMFQEDLGVLKCPYFLPDWGTAYPHKFIPWKAVEMQDRPYVYDFMVHLPGTDAKFVDKNGDTRTGKSLDVILKSYGYTGKDDFDGSMVYDTYHAGDLAKIMSYNKSEIDDMSVLWNKVRPRMWWGDL